MSEDKMILFCGETAYGGHSHGAKLLAGMVVLSRVMKVLLKGIVGASKSARKSVREPQNLG